MKNIISKFRNKIKIRKPSFKFKRPAIKEFRKPRFPNKLKPRLPSKIKSKLPKISLHRPKLIPQRVKIFYANRIRPILGRIKHKLKSIWNIYRHSKILILFSMICLVFISVIVALFLIQPSVKVDFVELKAPTVEDQIILTSNTDKLDMFGEDYYAILPNGKEVLLDRYKFNADDFEQGDNLLKIHTVKPLVLLNLVSEESIDVDVFVDTEGPHTMEVNNSSDSKTFVKFIKTDFYVTEDITKVSLLLDEVEHTLFDIEEEDNDCTIGDNIDEYELYIQLHCKFKIYEESESKHVAVDLYDQYANRTNIIDEDFKLIIPFEIECSDYSRLVSIKSITLNCAPTKSGKVKYQSKEIDLIAGQSKNISFELKEGENKIPLELIESDSGEVNNQTFQFTVDTIKPELQDINIPSSYKVCPDGAVCINPNVPFTISFASNEGISGTLEIHLDDTFADETKGDILEEFEIPHGNKYSRYIDPQNFSGCTYGPNGEYCLSQGALIVKITFSDKSGNQNSFSTIIRDASIDGWSDYISSTGQYYEDYGSEDYIKLLNELELYN